MEMLNVSLKGVKKGEATSVAIMVLLSGNCFKSGSDKKWYRSLEKGNKHKAMTSTTKTPFSKRSLSSTRCDINGC
jgi:hypothetical protein